MMFNQELAEFDNQDEMTWGDQRVIPVYVVDIDDTGIHFELESGGMVSSYEIAHLQFKPRIEQQIYLVTEEYEVVAVLPAI